MQPINETEQPVKPAPITANDVMDYVAKQNSVILTALSDEKRYAIAPELIVKARYLLISAYLLPDYQQVTGMGPSIMEAINAFRADLDFKRKEQPRKLREEAARKLVEAEELEAVQGGAA